MESADADMINVNQRDVKAMLEERILNPKKYIDKPMLIWRGYFEDGIQDEVFFNFNPYIKERINKQNQQFLSSNDYDPINVGKDDVAIPRWVTLKWDNLRDNSFYLPDKGSNPYRVFCFFFDLPEEDLVNPPLYNEYSDIINKEWLVREQEGLKAPIVLYLPFVERPQAFEGYDQYVFSPDFDEWKEKLSDSKNELTKHLVGFLERSKNVEERQYRWYWYFQRQKRNENSPELKSRFEGSGCDFPSCWMEGLYNLRRHFILPMAQIPKNYIPPKPVKIAEIPADEFKAFFKEGISEDLIDDFRNYLIEHNVEIQGNKRNR